jgi:HEAT repeat protein
MTNTLGYRDPMTADEIAAAVLDDNDDLARHALEDLARHPESAPFLLGQLAGHPDVDVRSWVSGAARALMPAAEAVPILSRLISDKDKDVRDTAITDLIAVDRSAAANALIPRLRARLGADHEFPLFAAGHLAELRDYESLPAIRALAETASRHYVRRGASIVALLLEGREVEVLRRLRAHEHESTWALADVALMVGTPEARAAVEQCAASAPDEECRRECRNALANRQPVQVRIDRN